MAVWQKHLKTLSVSLTDTILTISMNRPKVNAMSAEMLTELAQTFDQASNDKNIKGVLLRSNSSSIFSSGIDLSSLYTLCIARQQPPIDKFIFDTLIRGLTAPLHCSKPVACSLDGHTIAGGLILALACDYIAMGTRKPFRLGITGLLAGVPYPHVALKIVQHQLEPQLAHRLLVDASLLSSDTIAFRCEKNETPDELSRKWLEMMSERPLGGFTITKRHWWSDVIELATIDNEQEKQEYFQTIISEPCLQAMKKVLKK